MQRRIRACDDADRKRQQICRQPERDRHRHRLPQDGVDRLSLISQRQPKVAAQCARDGLAVLDVPRLVETVALADVLFDRGRKRFLASVEVSGRETDESPRHRHHDQHHGKNDEEPADDEPYHPSLALCRKRATAWQATWRGRARCRRTSRRAASPDSDTSL